MQNRGFKLNFTATDAMCGGIIKDDHGMIRSPVDVENYPHGADCHWIIQAPAGSVIRLTWLTFALESHDNCRYDYVEVYDNNTIPGAGGRIGR